MAITPYVQDGIYQTSTTTGTGNFTLATVSGYVAFSDATYGFNSGATLNVFPYYIRSNVAAEWEFGTGHMSNSTTLVRDTVLESSNANALVNFSAGVKDVTNDVPSSRQSSYFIQSTVPANYGLGDRWLDTSTGILYTFIQDASGDQFWVECDAAGTWGSVNATNMSLTVPGEGMDSAVNCGLAASAAASALTISLKGADGNDPSPLNPVLVPFRDSSQASGNITWLSITAPLSLVVSSGSTLGTSNATAFRLWVFLFNDAGTARLGVMNATTCTTTAMNMFPLVEYFVASANAEGGAGAADLAQTCYAGVAITNKGARILGWIEWGASGVATAGTWTTTNLLRIQIYGTGQKKPGDVVQTIYAAAVRTDSNASTTFVTTGHQISMVIVSACNPLRITASATAQNASATQSDYQLSRGTTANTNMIGSLLTGLGAAGWAMPCTLTAWDLPNTTGSQTYAVQFRTPAGTAKWGVGGNTVIEITEYMA